ncbi:glutathione peroxidase [Stylonychia lemnae]|uniref:Glutathione peroxidase n=1 Tax=Stylonychia lemnae TaxID=5949 RepID=A0A078AX01_STYLE|nr:glutathione peroxidase [Stylonychia lemnae]|eukprot:CDW85782.1 glutathione peroxidase [Stylonychia lemnae]
MGNNLKAQVFFKKNKEKVESKYNSILEIQVEDINSSQVLLQDLLKDKKCTIIVNVASKCGLSQKMYSDLVKTYEKFHDQGLEILAFPCNQFMNQEPGSNLQILEYARETHGVQFPIFAKTEVNGKRANELFKYLRASCPDLRSKNSKVKALPWNFCKFILDQNGQQVKYLDPKTTLESNFHVIQKVINGEQVQNEDQELQIE